MWLALHHPGRSVLSVLLAVDDHLGILPTLMSVCALLLLSFGVLYSHNRHLDLTQLNPLGRFACMLQRVALLRLHRWPAC